MKKISGPSKTDSPKNTTRKKIRTGPSLISYFVGFTGLIIITGLIFGFLELLHYSQNFLAPETTSREIVVTIPAGSSYPQIAKILADAGAIKSTDAFIWAIKIKNRLKQSVNIKAGEQALDPSVNVWQTISVLVEGNFKRYPFTIPEGRTMTDIALAVEAAGLGQAKEFLALCRDATFISSLGLTGNSLEGYLFPETYSFPKGTPLKTIIKAMVDQFFKVWAKYDNKTVQRNLSLHEIVTMASIVEKETGAPEERPIIAEVFFNRLSKGMRLQTDPTVIYGLPNYNGNITRADLETKHPYNTYVIDGLPPGPIASPGEAALAAVVTPARGKYLYFVSKNDGTHYFSETLAEHNRMVAKYQKSRNSNKP